MKKIKEQFASTVRNYDQYEFLRNVTCPRNDKLDETLRRDEYMRMQIWDH